MKDQDKIIEICKNLQQTIGRMNDLPQIVKSKSTAYEHHRVSKSVLINKLDYLKEKYNLTKNDF